MIATVSNARASITARRDQRSQKLDLLAAESSMVQKFTESSPAAAMP